MKILIIMKSTNDDGAYKKELEIFKNKLTSNKSITVIEKSCDELFDVENTNHKWDRDYPEQTEWMILICIRESYNFGFHPRQDNDTVNFLDSVVEKIKNHQFLEKKICLFIRPSCLVGTQELSLIKRFEQYYTDFYTENHKYFDETSISSRLLILENLATHNSISCDDLEYIPTTLREFIQMQENLVIPSSMEKNFFYSALEPIRKFAQSHEDDVKDSLPKVTFVLIISGLFYSLDTRDNLWITKAGLILLLICVLIKSADMLKQRPTQQRINYSKVYENFILNMSMFFSNIAKISSNFAEISDKGITIANSVNKTISRNGDLTADFIHASTQLLVNEVTANGEAIRDLVNNTNAEIPKKVDKVLAIAADTSDKISEAANTAALGALKIGEGIGEGAKSSGKGILYAGTGIGEGAKSSGKGMLYAGTGIGAGAALTGLKGFFGGCSIM